MRFSLYPFKEKRDAVFRGIGRQWEVEERDKRGQVCIPVSQLRCQLELLGEGRPAWKNTDQSSNFRVFQQSAILLFLGRALWIIITLPLSVICLHMYFGKRQKTFFSLKKIYFGGKIVA